MPRLPRSILFVVYAVLIGGCAPSPATTAAEQRLAIQPSTVEVDAEGRVAFNAHVAGTPDSRVAWGVAPATGSVDSSGVYTAPTTAGDYAITATSLSTSVRATAIVRVRSRGNSVPPAITTFTSSPAIVSPGDSVTLSWAVGGAKSLSLDPGGTVTGDSVVVSPTTTTTYRLTATNNAGTTSATVVVTVAEPSPPPAPAPTTPTPAPTPAAPPSIDAFTASATTVAAGGATTLSWQTTGASSVSLDNAIGAVPTSGTRTVSPSVTTTYTLSAANAAGTTSRTVTITVSSGVSTTTLMQQIAADMTGSNEAYPHGVPVDWGFAQGPVPGMMNDPVHDGITSTAATAWGIVYEAAQGNPATNSRVNVRNVKLLFKSKRAGTWSVVQSTSQPAGNDYYEDLAGQSTFPADRRTEPDGSFSVKVGGGYMYHFFPSARASFDPTDIGGWIAIFEARLILDDPSGPDDRAIAQLLAAPGADYYPSTTGSWGPNGAPAIADGKMKYVRSYWRWYAITTLSATELTANPPPLQLAGISQ